MAIKVQIIGIDPQGVNTPCTTIRRTSGAVVIVVKLFGNVSRDRLRAEILSADHRASMLSTPDKRFVPIKRADDDWEEGY